MRLFERLLMRAYGVDAAEEEKRTEETHERVTARREARVKAHGAPPRPSAEDYAEWFGLKERER